MAKLKFKSNGKWESIAAFQGEPGKDGAIQYTAGEGITIENDTISAEVTKQYVDDAIGGIEIPESGGSDNVYVINQGMPSNLVLNGFANETTLSIDNNNRDIIAEYIPRLIEDYMNGKKVPLVFIFSMGMGNNWQISLQLLDNNPTRNHNEFIFTGLHVISQNKIHYYKYRCVGSWTDNVYSITSNTLTVQNLNLDKMATQQYVDDAVANAGGGSEEKISHYYISVSSSTTDPNTNYSVNLSSRTEELIALCTNAHQDIVNGVTPLLHLQLNYKTIANEQRCSYLTMQLDELRPSHIGADVPFVFKRLSKFENAFNDKFILHRLHISYNKSSGQITNASFSCSVSEYSTKKYVDDAIAAIDIPESGGSAIDFGNTPVYLVSTASGTNATAQHYILDNYNAPDYGASLRKAVSSGLKQFIISIYFTGYGMSLDLRYTIDDNGSILVLPIRLPFQVSIGSYIIGYSPAIENMVTNISSVETASMYLRVQNMHNPAYCPIEKNTASKSYVDNAIAALKAELGGE